MSVYTASIKIDATAAEAGSRLFEASVERARQSFSRLKTIEQTTGVTGRSDSAARAADIEAYGREIDRLRAKYVPLAAAQQQYMATLREIQSAQRVGALSAQESAAAIEQTKAAFANQVTAMRQAREATAAAGQSMGALRNQALTLQYTLSDIAASLGSGASPLTILMQQGPQVAQAFSKAAGGPGLMAAALAALTSPIGLAVIGFGTLAAVAGTVLFRASDLAKETRVYYKDLAENSLSSMDKALLSVGRAWTGFIDRVANSSVVLELINRAAQSIELIDRVTGGTQSVESLQKERQQLLDYKSPFPFLDDGLPALFGGKTDTQKRAERLAEIDRQLSLRNSPQSRFSVPGSSDFVGPLPVSETSPANQRTAQQLELDKQQEELDRRLRVLGASPVNRAALQARLEVADNTTLSGDIDDPKSEKGRAAIIAETRARAELAATVRDQTAAVNANVKGNLEAADAYQTSAAAGFEADARRQAGVEALTQAINVNIRTREILAERISGEIAASSQQLEANRNEVINAERLAEAQKRGAGAYAEAELAIKQQTATQQFSTLIQVAERNLLVELAEKLKTLKGEREEQIASIEKANRATQQSIDLRRADQEVGSAQAGASAAQIIDPTERRAAEIAIERQRELNRLLEGGKKTTEEIGELMQRWDLKTAADEQSRFWNDVRQTASGVSKDVSSFLTDGVTGALANGKSGFKDFWDGALQGGKRFIARLAATFLEQKIILPIAMQVVGGLPQAFGIAAPAGVGGVQAGSSGGMQLPSFGGGGGFSGLTNGIDRIGASLGFSAAPQAVGGWTVTGVGGPSVAGLNAGAAGAFGGSTLSSILPYAGAGIGVLTNLASGNVAGAATTAAGAAIGSIIPGVGTAIGAAVGGVLGSFFGGKKPSVGPGGGIGFGVGADGKVNVGFSSQDNGYDPIAKNMDAAQSVADAAAKLIELLGGKLTGTAVAGRGAELGYDAGLRKFTGGDDTSNGRGRFDTIEQAMAASVTAVYIDNLNSGGGNVAGWLATINSNKGQFWVRNASGSKRHVFSVTSATANSGFYTIAVVYGAGEGGNFAANETVILSLAQARSRPRAGGSARQRRPRRAYRNSRVGLPRYTPAAGESSSSNWSVRHEPAWVDLRERGCIRPLRDH